jgi:hypothetical protein
MQIRRILPSLLLCAIASQPLMPTPSHAKSSTTKKTPAKSAAVAKGCKRLVTAAKFRDAELERIGQRTPIPLFDHVFVMGSYYLNVAILSRTDLKTVITVDYATKLRLVVRYFNEITAIAAAMDPNDPEPAVKAMDAAITAYGGEEVILSAMNDIATFIEKTCGVGTA